MRVRVCLLLFFAIVGSAAQMPTYPTRHYRITSDLDPARVASLGAALDAMFDSYLLVFPDVAGEMTQPFPVVIFNRQADYLAYLQAQGYDAHGTSGTSNADGMVVWTDQRPWDRVQNTLRHEGFHQFAHHYFRHALPQWANEGMAEYFADGIPGDKRLLTGLLRHAPLQHMQQIIRDNSYVPFTRLWSLSHADWRASMSTQPLYDEAWSVVYFLLHSHQGQYRAAFVQYLLAVDAGKTSDAAFTAAFHIEGLGTLETEWKAYLITLEQDALSRVLEKELPPLLDGMKVLQERQVAYATLDELVQALQNAKLPVTAPADSVLFPTHATPVPAVSLIITPNANPTLPPELLLKADRRTLAVHWQRTSQQTLDPVLSVQ